MFRKMFPELNNYSLLVLSVVIISLTNLKVKSKFFTC